MILLHLSWSRAALVTVSIASLLAACGGKVVVDAEDPRGPAGPAARPRSPRRWEPAASAPAAPASPAAPLAAAAPGQRPMQRFAKGRQATVATAQACNPAISSLQCSGVLTVTDTCGCTVVANEKTLVAAQLAAKAFNTWVGAGCGPFQCSPALQAPTLRGSAIPPRWSADRPSRSSYGERIGWRSAHDLASSSPGARRSPVGVLASMLIACGGKVVVDAGSTPGGGGAGGVAANTTSVSSSSEVAAIASVGGVGGAGRLRRAARGSRGQGRRGASVQPCAQRPSMLRQYHRERPLRLLGRRQRHQPHGRPARERGVQGLGQRRLWAHRVPPLPAAAPGPVALRCNERGLQAVLREIMVRRGPINTLQR